LFQSIGVAQLQYGGNIVETIEKSRETWHCGRVSFDLKKERELKKYKNTYTLEYVANMPICQYILRNKSFLEPVRYRGEITYIITYL